MTLLIALTACSELETPLRATLDDGQVLMGTVTTPTLLLEGAMGTIEIPVADIGEVEPVEGGALSGSNGHVTVWLRNGSELRGRWAEPQLGMGIQAGGQVIPVDLPMDQVMRVQLMEGQVWPEGLVYRVRTTHGDDFLIDPRTTQVSITNDLGTFSPFLSECMSLTPVDGNDGDWKVVLASGTVLVGPMTHDSFDFAMPMGPDRVETPLELVAGIDRQDWSGSSDYGFMEFESAPPMSRAEPLQIMDGSGLMLPPRPAAAEEVDTGAYERQQLLDEQVEGWFDNRSMRAYKQTQM